MDGDGNDWVMKLCVKGVSIIYLFPSLERQPSYGFSTFQNPGLSFISAYKAQAKMNPDAKRLRVRRLHGNVLTSRTSSYLFRSWSSLAQSYIVEVCLCQRCSSFSAFLGEKPRTIPPTTEAPGSERILGRGASEIGAAPWIVQGDKAERRA